MAPQQGYETASQAAQASITEAFRAQQAFLAAIAIRDILSIWGLLSLRDVRSSWPAVKVALASLIRDRFGMAGAAGNAYYLQVRSAAGVLEDVPILELPPALDEALITATLDSTGPYSLLARIKSGQQVTEAVQNTGVQLSGAASRLILNGARMAVLTAVQEDSKAVAWMRVTAANPCSWCAMLASRGPIYRTEASAGFKAHNNCRCVAQACFSAEDAEALRDNDLYQQWQQVTQGHSGKYALRAWRRYWDAAHPEAPGVAQPGAA
jgi:hypothetical protein